MGPIVTQATTHNVTDAEAPTLPPDAPPPRRGRPGVPAWLWPSWEQRKRSLYWQAWVVTVVAWVLFPAAWLMPDDWTNTSPAFVLAWWALFLVLTFELHAAIALGVIAIIATVRRLGWLAVASGVLALILLRPVYVAMWPDELPGAGPGAGNFPGGMSGPPLRVMSANLLMINRQVEPMLAEIIAADPDVILLQEYAPHWHRAMQERLLPDWPHYIGVPQSDSFGIAIYSRFPLEDATAGLPLDDLGIPQIRATVRMPHWSVDVYNIHLLPPRTLWYTTEHRLQFDRMVRMLAGGAAGSEQRAYFIGGDFNFTDASPQAAALGELGLTDAQDLAGSGLGLTWPVNSALRYAPVPGLRLDHVYLSPGLTARDMAVGVGPGSDHRPLVVTVGLR